MIRQTLNAVYKNGVFTPMTLPQISEGQQVRIIVEIPSDSTDLLELASLVYEGLSEKEIDEIEKVALNRDNFFKNRGTS